MALVTAAQVRADVEYNLGFGSGKDNSTRIDAHIARAYEEEVPILIQGAAKRRQLIFNLVAGTDTYDVDTLAAAASSPFAFYGIRSHLILLADSQLTYYTDPEKFWLAYTFSDVAQNKPGGVLHDGRSLQFRSVPDSNYQVVLWCTGSRDPFPTPGITKLEADLVTDLATFSRAKDLAMTNTMDRFAKKLEVSARLVAGKFKASIPAREPLRTPGF